MTPRRALVATAFGITALTTVGGATAAALPPTLTYCQGVLPAHEKVLNHAPTGVPTGLQDLYDNCVK